MYQSKKASRADYTIFNFLPKKKEKNVNEETYFSIFAASF